MKRALAASLLPLLLVAGCATPEPEGQAASAGGAPVDGVAEPPPASLPSPSPRAAPTPDAPSPAPAPTTPPPAQDARFPGCLGSGPVGFRVSPMREEDFASIIPYGLMVSSHVTPIDHMYFTPADDASPRDAYEVRAIADGVIYAIAPRDINVDRNEAKAREWRLDIAHTCTFHSYFDLLTSLDPEIEAAYNASREGRWNGHPVKAGQLVGRIGAQTLDFGVYDYNVTLPGLLVPESYAYEPWKIHTVDPFPYFPEDVREMLLAKNLRTAEPRAGRIDYDVDGRAVGNWFAQGTNGYAGDGRWNYWEGHLALAYDHLDPTHVVASLGNVSGEARQFGVKGNAPDPGNVSVETGLVAYELVHYQHYARNDPTRQERVRPGDDVGARNHDYVEGVLLVQLLEPRLLKAEVFPGRTAAEVGGFTDAARLYER